MKISKLLLGVAVLAGALTPVSVLADPPSTVNTRTAVCDPSYPLNCAKPSNSGVLPVSGVFSATIGGFTPGGTYASLSVSGSSSRVALPAGLVVIVYNTGTNPAYITLGGNTAVATTGNDVVSPGGALALTVGANTYLAGITASSTTTLNISGGAGLPTGWGASPSSVTSNQGTAGSAGSAWYVQPGTGATWAISSLPALAAGSNVIGAVTQSGTWNIGTVTTLPALVAGSAIIGKVGIDQTTPGTTNGVQINAALPAGGNTIGAVTQASGPWTSNVTQFGSSNVATGTGASGAGVPRVTVSNDSSVLTPITGTATNPTSTLTRPANTTAYAASQLVASSTTAGSVTVPNFAIANSAGGAVIPRVRLTTNATTGWGTTLTVTLWRTAPTYTNGDGGTYAVATGASGMLAQFSCALTQYGDGATGNCAIAVGNFLTLALASGTAVYWDVQTTAAATPISGQTFTLTAEVLN